jgi:signal transduction histidine kinase
MRNRRSFSPWPTTASGSHRTICADIQRFYRVDKARSREVGGSGLGLSIVKHAVERMGGAVAVESQLGEGSKFSVTLRAA